MMAGHGPRWTRKRLVGLLESCYGVTVRGAVNADAVAQALGVTPRTVHRWMAGSNRRKAAIPSIRLEQLVSPPTEIALRHQQQVDYAQDAVAEIGLPKGRGILPAWRTNGWLDSHVVAVIAPKGTPWRQLVVSNGSARSMTELRRRGDILDLTTVPTRFHGVVLAHEVFRTVHPWRVYPSATKLKTGRTQVWANDAPAVDLSVIAVAHELRG